MKTLNGTGRPNGKALKKKFLECFAYRSSGATALQGVVKWLIGQGISRKTLVAWAVQAGYTQGTVASLLSRIFCALGLRERRPGAGRKPSPDALELLAHAKARYRGRYLNVLQAALRAGKTQMTAPLGKLAPHSSQAPALIAPSVLRSSGANNGFTITRNGGKAGRSRVNFHQSARIIFKSNVNPRKKAGSKLHHKRL